MLPHSHTAYLSIYTTLKFSGNGAENRSERVELLVSHTVEPNLWVRMSGVEEKELIRNAAVVLKMEQLFKDGTLRTNT